MKKLLLLSAIAFSAATISAQDNILKTENFEALSIGNVGTDITGATPGQGGYLTRSTAGGTNSSAANFQIVANDATHNKVLQIQGSNAATGSKLMYDTSLPAAWDSRTVGNDIIEAEYEFYTGPATASTNTSRFYIYDAAKTKVLGGFFFNQNTKAISGVAYYDASSQPGGTIASYTFYLGTGATDIILPANTWVKVGVAFDTSSGDVTWKGPGFYGGVTGAAAGTDPFEYDFIVAAGTANAVSSTNLFDNLVLTATATENLLGTKDASIHKSSISVFPNPTTDFLNVNASKISSIEIFDIAGKSLKVQKSAESKVNVTNLQPGVYLIKVTSASGVSTQKFIKK